MVGIVLRTKTYAECVSIRDAIKSSVETEGNPAVFAQLIRNLAIVENYIDRVYSKSRRRAFGPLTINESAWTN